MMKAILMVLESVRMYISASRTTLLQG